METVLARRVPQVDLADSRNAQGGVLEIGKDDRGQVVGVTNPLRLLEEIPNKVQSLLGIVVEVNLKAERGPRVPGDRGGASPEPDQLQRESSTIAAAARSRYCEAPP